MNRFALYFICMLAVSSWSEPVDCLFLEEGRATKGLGCRCVVKEIEQYNRQYKINVQTCLGGKSILHIVDIREGNKWRKAKGSQCSKLEEINKYSCQTYNFLQDDWYNKSKLTTQTPAQIIRAFNDQLDQGDVKYLQIK